VPNYPFEHICVDYMSLNGCQFGVFVDRYTGWPVVIMGTTGFDVTKFLGGLQGEGQLHLRRGPNLTAKLLEDMMEDDGIHHKISSVANPHTN
jgi:hypothetical protein